MRDTRWHRGARRRHAGAVQTADLDIRPVSAEDPGQDDLFRAWAATFDEAGRHSLGDAHAGWRVEELRELARSTERRRVSWVAVAGDAVVGALALTLPQHDNRTVAEVLLAVRPQHRRRGVGTKLLEAAERAARDEGRSVLLAGTEWAFGERDEAGEEFAARHGYAAAQTILRSTLPLPADRDRLRAVLAARDDGYTTATCWDGIPDGWLEGRAELSRRMSTDVPLGDLRLEEEVWDEERVRRGYARIAAMERRVVDTFAVEQSTGRLVGYSQVQVGAHADLGYQQDTLVLREHRGHGLGLRLKAASTLAVMAELPRVRRIRTWNADDNHHMLAVNRELGYEPDAWMREWQKVL